MAPLLTLCVLTLGSRGAERPIDAARLTLDALLESRRVYALSTRGTHSVAGPEYAARRAEALTDLARLADMNPTQRAYRRLALMQHAMGDEGWRATLLRMRDLPGAASPFDVQQELAMWRDVLEADPIKRYRIPALRSQIESLDLGWYQHLALEALYRKGGDYDAAQSQITAAERSTEALYRFSVAEQLLWRAGTALAVAGGAVYLWRRRHPGGTLPGWLAPHPPPALSRPQADALYRVFLAYLGAYTVVQLVVVRALGGPWAEGVRALPPAVHAALPFGLMALWLVVPWAVYRREASRADLTRESVGLRCTRWPADALWGIAGYGVAWPLVWMATGVSAWLFRGADAPLHPALTEFATTQSAIVHVLLFAQAALIAPVAEETMFRGVFYRALGPRIGTVGAVVVASAIFALLHPQMPLGFLGLFVLGVVFTLLYLARGSLVAPMVAHALNNGVIFVSLALLTGN